MKKQITKDTFQRLYETAQEQEGLLTAAQAIEAGYIEKNHAYHVHTDIWIREHRGIYRLATFPLADRWDLVLWYAPSTLRFVWCAGHEII